MKSTIFKKLALGTLALLLIVALTISGLQLNFNNNVSQLTLTIGNPVYADTVVDYTTDGTDDHIQFQAAFNALPATGGKIVCLAGTYTFGATVTRAINNVTIEGAGVATIFNYDAGTALFTAGGDNWVFRDLTTDAGGITFGATTGYEIHNCQLGATYYASYFDAGNITTDGLVSPLLSSSAITIKPNGDTDDYFSFETLSNIPTIKGVGSYTRFGDAGTTSHSLNSGDDVLFSGNLEVRTSLYVDKYVYLADAYPLNFGASSDIKLSWNTEDSNANLALIRLGDGGSTNVTALVLTTDTGWGNLGLLDGVTQPLFVTLPKGNLLHSASNGIANAGGATAILNHVGGFTNAVVGDPVRITAGTLCTTGWYWITTVTSADTVVLDRNYTSGDTTDVTFVTLHDFTMLSAEGVCTRLNYGMPTDSSVEIDRDGWLISNVENNQLVHRSGTIWRAIQNAVKTVEAVTVTNALTEAESGSVFTNLGDGDGSTCTLPANSSAGTNYTFSIQAAQELKVIVGQAGDKLYIGGTISTDDGGNDLYVSADDEGETITLCSDGADGWFVTSISGTWSVTQP